MYFVLLTHRGDNVKIPQCVTCHISQLWSRDRSLSEIIIFILISNDYVNASAFPLPSLMNYIKVAADPRN